jgi:shikimate dehydrogenase
MASTGEEHLTSTPLLQVGLIGNPVAHSFSPRFQQAAFDALGIPARYELWPTLPGDLPARVASLLTPQCMGANITIPYKEAVMPLLDVVDPLATRIGAVNTIVHRNEYLYGYNTDAYGLLHALSEQGIGQFIDEDNISLRNYTAVLLGAGGAARSAAFALASASIKQLIIVNRGLERAQRLAADVQQNSECQVFCLSDPDFLMPHPASLIINATSVGMHSATGQEGSEGMSPLPAKVLARFAPDTFVFDMIYNPTQTQLLCQARILGLRAANGLTMLLHQGALAFKLWTDQPAPLEIMRVALL